MDGVVAEGVHDRLVEGQGPALLERTGGRWHLIESHRTRSGCTTRLETDVTELVLKGRQLNELDKMTREQQHLRDETFRNRGQQDGNEKEQSADERQRQQEAATSRQYAVG